MIGVGSEIRGDDAAGMALARRLETRVASSGASRFRVYLGETAPENHTGELKRFKPERILLLDTADFGRPAGETVLASAEEITEVAFSTHRLPLFVLMDYLRQSFPCEVSLLGIQPATLGLFHPMTAEVAATVDALFDGLVEALEKSSLLSDTPDSPPAS